MKNWLAALLISVSSSVSATSLTRDYSDLWFTSSESGWGANMIQQGEIIFLTIFVYQSNGQPIWFVGDALAFQGTTGTTQRFTGTLYQTAGPFYGSATFNPNNVVATPVGTATFTATSATAGTLSYSVNGVNVNKNVVRQTWRMENIAGVYQGATIGTYSNCSAGNGPYESVASFTITQQAQSITIAEFGTGYTCNYTGILAQSGRMGTITGTGSCTPGGAAQTFTASEVRVDPNGINMSLIADAGPCHFTGRIGGIRRQ
jgi:hypothetical protein